MKSLLALLNKDNDCEIGGLTGYRNKWSANEIQPIAAKSSVIPEKNPSKITMTTIGLTGHKNRWQENEIRSTEEEIHLNDTSGQKP